MSTNIKVTLRTIDRYSKTARFKTVKGARKFAHKYVGAHPDISHTFGYAVDAYGGAKIMIDGEVAGRPVTFKDVFPSHDDLADEAFEAAKASEPTTEPEPVKPAVKHEDDRAHVDACDDTIPF